MRKPLTLSAHQRMIKTLVGIRRRHSLFVGSLIVLNFILIFLALLGPASSASSSDAVVMVNATQGLGTAFFVNKQQGYLLTAAHVVSNDAQVQLVLRDGTLMDAQVLLTEPNRDIALLKALQSGNIPPPLSLGDSQLVNEADQVYVIGYPGGEYSITTGIIANKTPELLKTDAATNPGNSGGPLLNKANNMVIGVIVSSKQIQGQRAEGQHYAVPIEAAESICQAKGYILRETK